ncbi:MAG: hypothetical protein HYY06_23745 [Deltaproteobacteria bacterium]|nr:hypothetical protein [Deltaproteobacteria bacterium]
MVELGLELLGELLERAKAGELALERLDARVRCAKRVAVVRHRPRQRIQDRDPS